MSLDTADLQAIKQLIDESIEERLPKIIDERVPNIIDERVPQLVEAGVPEIIDARVQPMFDRLEKRLTVKIDQLARDIDQLTIDIGQHSLETTDNFLALNAHVDDLDDGLATIVEMTDNNRVEIQKIERKLSLK